MQSNVVCFTTYRLKHVNSRSHGDDLSKPTVVRLIDNLHNQRLSYDIYRGVNGISERSYYLPYRFENGMHFNTPGDINRRLHAIRKQATPACVLDIASFRKVQGDAGGPTLST